MENLRKSVKAENPEAIIIGEVWEDASNKESYGARRKFLLGEQLDSVMNYVFRGAILDFCRGQEARYTMAAIMSVIENYPRPVLRVLMNSLSTHDTERALTVIAGEPLNGRDRCWQANTHLSREQRERGVKLLKIAAAMQYTLPGFPCVYQLPDPGAPERGEQNQRHDGEIDYPADPDEPDGAFQLPVYESPVRNQEGQGQHRNHKLVADQTDGDGRRSVAHGNSGFVHGSDLHGLAAAGAGCDIAVEKAAQRDADDGAGTQQEPLSAQAEPDADPVAAGIDRPAAQKSQDIQKVQAPNGVPGVVKLLVAEGYADHGRHGQHNDENAQGFFQLLVHAASSESSGMIYSTFFGRNCPALRIRLK